MSKQVELQDVFVTSGMPTYTFVRPAEYGQLLVAIKTPGKGVVIEGPSGIGKTTAVNSALREAGMDVHVTRLSARSPQDVEYIRGLPEFEPFGVVVVDDFHRLDEVDQKALADLIKVMADCPKNGDKLIIIGINKAGKKLIDFGLDLATRIEVIQFEQNSHEKIGELVKKGEDVLNIKLSCRSGVVSNANGSFYVAQALCSLACITAEVFTRCDMVRTVDVDISDVVKAAMRQFDNKFHDVVQRFVRGPRFRRNGRAPYFHLLRWLGESKSLSIDVANEMNRHPIQKPSVGQILTKGYLKDLILREFSDLLFISGGVLIANDPMLVFYLSNLDWGKLRKEVGYADVEDRYEYDVALSFAGEDRKIASALNDQLSKEGLSVFYDQDFQADILAANVKKYLKPIYESVAKYVVCILGSAYSEKKWTEFESDLFEKRIAQTAVIPILVPPAKIGATDKLRDIGRLEFNTENVFDEEIERIATMLVRKFDGCAAE